jgi:hypothetical protein
MHLAGTMQGCIRPFATKIGVRYTTEQKTNKDSS